MVLWLGVVLLRMGFGCALLCSCLIAVYSFSKKNSFKKVSFIHIFHTTHSKKGQLYLPPLFDGSKSLGHLWKPLEFCFINVKLLSKLGTGLSLL